MKNIKCLLVVEYDLNLTPSVFMFESMEEAISFTDDANLVHATRITMYSINELGICREIKSVKQSWN